MDRTNADAVNELAVAAMEVREAGGIPFVTVPNGFKVESLEGYLEQPARVRTTLAFAGLVSALSYINRFKDEGSVVLLKRDGSFEAVLDYHEPAKALENGARWGTHRAQFKPTFSERWMVWFNAHKRPMDQRAFAEFVEDNAADFLAPSGGAMLDVARTLEAKQSVNFKSGIRTDNGDVSLVFEETTVAKAGQRGDLSIPSQFTIGIPVLLGEEPRPVEVRLKYVVKDGVVVFSIEILRLAAVLELITREIGASVKNATGIEPLLVA
jgi:uncharacterized protein YfdQ (DUF2303 family)